uniref:IpaD/SipD/SspD family type III secretion system needle tip protein n=1 Tax=Providencia stuartii TaxID=588 RepID=A0AAI9DEQ3_PROST|nr:hypothetical protein [Providencia stuartii]
MSTNLATIRQPSDLQSMFFLKASINDNINTSPLEGGDFVADPTKDPIQQAEDILLHYGVKVSEKISLPTFNMPEGLSDEQQYQWMMNSAKLANLEFKATRDKSNIAMISARKDVIEDGRPHITSIYDLIGNINSNYQKSFGEITKNATKFMEKVNNALGKMSSYISAGSDGKINFRKNDFLAEFKKNFSDMIWTDSVWGTELNVDNIDHCVKPIASFDSKPGMYDFFSKKLSGQGFFVKEFGGKVHIYPDFNSIIKISNTVNSAANGDIMSQAFQSLQTALDSHKNSVNNSVSRLLETFRQDNSHFETLTQLLIQLLKDLFQYNAGFANT